MEEFNLLFLVLLIPIITCFIYFFFSKRNQDGSKKFSSSNKISFPLLKDLRDYVRNRDRFLDWITDKLEESSTDTILLEILLRGKEIVTTDVDNIEYILKSNFQNYPKGYEFTSMFHDLLGNGIFNSDDELWKLQRKLASFEFNVKSLRNFALHVVNKEIESNLLPILMRASDEDEIIDLQMVLGRFTFNSICKMAFDETPSCNSEEFTEFTEAFQNAADQISERFFYVLPFLWKVKRFLNIGSEKKLKQSISTVNKFAMRIIQSRKKDEKSNLSSKHDFLTRFIEKGEDSDEFLRDIIVNFILAGQETTSSSLVWLFHLLSCHPETERKILNEIVSIRNRNQNFGVTFTFDELTKDFNYTHAAISESLRLFPVAPYNWRECRNGDVLPDGTIIGKGWTVTFCPYSMARMETIWGHDCRDFKPERWLQNGTFCPESPNRYPIFHAGPRLCLGKDMAYLQMKAVACAIIERFEIDVQDKATQPTHYLSLVMKKMGGLPVRLRKRTTV